MAKQDIPAGPLLGVGDEVWVLQPTWKKLESKNLGPTVITSYDIATKKYTLTDA